MGEGKTVFEEVVEQVEYALDSTQAPQGGNPLTNMDEVGIEKCPIIALNRYHIPDKKFWNNVVPTDVQNPYKASAAVRFSIRVHFRDDFAYIDFGCPWEATEEYGTGSLSSETEDKAAFINEFQLLHCHFISKEDAIEILKGIFETKYTAAFTPKEVAASFAMLREEEIMTTELVDEDGTVIAL